jgi:hypothetical protein
MIPREDVIVVTIRPELRFALRIAAPRIRAIPAETMPQFVSGFTAVFTRVVIVDCRDAPTLARKVVNYMRRYSPMPRTILVTPAERYLREPVCDVTIRDGCDFFNRLRSAISVAIARKRGPQKKEVKSCQPYESSAASSVCAAGKPVTSVKPKSCSMIPRSA